MESAVLFGYPIQAVTDNWLHDCLQESLCQIYKDIQSGNAPREGLDLIPNQYQDRLKKYTSIHDKLTDYRKAFEQLDRTEQEQVLQMLREQKQIPDLLSGQCNCQTFVDLPEPIRIPIKNLFEIAFEKLTPLKLRDKQYKHIYDTASHHVCPFCGCEYFDAPGAPREALDHFLPESKYPFAAANLRNLVPMGNKCNSRYKLAQDILWNDNGTRRKVFDPYNHTYIRISLDRSQPFVGDRGNPCWNIDFEPDCEEIATWDAVFKIRERYTRDVLNGSFRTWLSQFASWCRSANLFPSSDDQLINGLERYSVHLEDMGYQDHSFLKAATFRMLHRYCQQGNRRLINFIRGIVESAQGRPITSLIT
jgi:hypothetical protein